MRSKKLKVPKKVRLSKRQKNDIIDVLCGSLSKKAHLQIYLFGSRTLLSKKGGDIDLLLLLKNKRVVERLKENDYIILRKIKDRLGDQKIDLAISTHLQIKKSSFLSLIFPKAVCLYSRGDD